jgi:hypothetical protein
MRHDDFWPWVRDWALIGATTSAIAPLMAAWTPLRHVEAYALTCAVLAAISGAAVGALLRALLQAFPRRAWVSVSLVVAPLVLGSWGGLVAGAACWWHYDGDLLLLAVPTGAVAAVVQTGWMAPAYAWLSSRPWPRPPLVVTSAVLSAPIAGGFGVAAGLGVLQLFRVW